MLFPWVSPGAEGMAAAGAQQCVGVELFLLSLAFKHHKSLSVSLLGCLLVLGHRAARAFGEYLSQNHPEGRNGSGKTIDVPWLCPVLNESAFIYLS